VAQNQLTRGGTTLDTSSTTSPATPRKPNFRGRTRRKGGGGANIKPPPRWRTPSYHSDKTVATGALAAAQIRRKLASGDIFR